MLLPGCIYAGFTVVLGPFPLSAETANAIHVHGNVQQSAHAPFILSDLAKNPTYLENLSRLDQVTFGGGSLPKAVGDAIAAKTKLLNCLGTTESGALPSHILDKEDWQYMSYSHVVGSEFRQISEDLYEHFIVRDPKLDMYQAFFQTFPDLDEWPMKDLYAKHPTKENLWLYRGRTDDVIVFSSGANLNPIEMESIIDSNPAVNAALVIGTGYPRSGLLIEAANSPANEEEKNKLVDTIWPSVEAANKPISLSRRIHHDMIIFTSADKPMLRAGKGTVQRKLTVDEYSSEIEALYKATESLGVGFTSDWVREGQ
jgi:acyl-coenzyme A synthetase/AMP-(fatty) acid ligase